MDSVRLLLEKSQFYDKDQVMDLYFIKGSAYEKLIGYLGVNNIASSKFDTHIYLGKPNFNTGILRKENNDYEWLNLVQIITHEGVHSQMNKEYSTLGFMKTPNWVNEGYCEYISYQSVRNRNDYQLSKLYSKLENSNDSWIKTEYNAMTPRIYLRDRIIMEYLIDVRKMDILDIVKNKSLNVDSLLLEMKTHFNEASNNY